MNAPRPLGMGRALRRWIPVAAGLIGAPALWIAQMLGSELLAATVCDRHGVGPALAHRLPFGATLVGLAAIALGMGLVCALLVARAVQLARRSFLLGETPDDGTRFLAQCGLLVALGFVIGLVFTGIVFHFVEPCAPW